MIREATAVRPLLIAGAALLALAMATGTPSAGEAPGWGYSCADGAPFVWGLLDPSFALCGEGEAQSPIVIGTAGAIHKPLPALRFEYGPTALMVVNNGHTVQANVLTPGAGTLRVDGRSYRLQQFHWHTPSEHWLDGDPSPMELHLVHQAPGGARLVVGALVRAGDENAELAKFWDELPGEKGDQVDLTGFDLAKLLPAGFASYRYNGSLTTPPCDEGVRWAVLAEGVEMSPAQITAFQAIFSGDHFPVGNARPPLARNHRRVVSDVGVP